MMARGYGPSILTGARNSSGRKAVRQSHPDTSGLWTSLDGTLTPDRGGGRPLRHPPGPVAVFLAPGPHRTASGHGVHQKRRELIRERLGPGLDVADLAVDRGSRQGALRPVIGVL